MANKKVLLGHTAVDSGCIIITDPCYTADIPKLWEDKGMRDGELINEHECPMGVVVPTRFGDGIYPIFGFYNAAGEIVRVVVEFAPLED